VDFFVASAVFFVYDLTLTLKASFWNNYPYIFAYFVDIQLEEGGLTISKLPFDNQKWMLHFATNGRFLVFYLLTPIDSVIIG